MKSIIRFICMGLMILLVILPVTGCNRSSEPIERIELYPAHNPPEVPPGEGLYFGSIDPMPTQAWDFPELIVTSIFVGIRISKDLKEDVTFTKYTIFDPVVSSEYELGLPEESGPYEPGQILLLNLYDPWAIPAAKGQYEFRIYLGDRIVSKALFNIVD
jgi:hypothetical protein